MKLYSISFMHTNIVVDNLYYPIVYPNCIILCRLERSENRLRDLRGVVKDLSVQLLRSCSEGSPALTECARAGDDLSRKQRLIEFGQVIIMKAYIQSFKILH